MNFDNPKVAGIIQKIPAEQLLVIDWNIHTSEKYSVVYQDFGEPVYRCLKENLDRISKFSEFTFYYPPFTYHPKNTIEHFLRFCKDYNMRHSVVYEEEKFVIRKGVLYFLVSDRTLANLLDQCSDKGFEPGKEVGVISYNETPMKKYVKNGITVISTDFKLMGKKAAEFISGNKAVHFEVPTTMKIRSSL